MMTAGPLMSLISGVFALWIGFAERGNSRLQADGLFINRFQAALGGISTGSWRQLALPW